MLIRDLEYKTGLDRATIRYYEKEGLVEPQRQENGYRDYTQDHLSQLLKIKLLRQLGLSLDTIKELQQGTDDLDTAIKKQITALEAKIQQKQRAKAVCIQLRNDHANYETLDAEYYLHMLTQKEEHHLSHDFSENIQQPFHPWRRFFARMFDYAWIKLLLNILFSVILRIRPFANSWLDILLGFATLVLAIPIFAVMIHLWGTTPGKWLLGLSVVSENGNKLDYSAAKDREVEVFVRGCGLGLPVFSIVRLIMSYNFYRNQTPDLDDYVEYCYHVSKCSKIALLVIAVIILNVSNILIDADAFLPKHRGDLTVAEFAENYNFYAKILDENNLKLEQDGTFEGQYGAVVFEGGKAEITHIDFNYHIENGCILSISYDNTWTDITYISPVGLNCEIASITAVMSQEGASIIDLFRIVNVLSTTDKCTDGQIDYKNVTVSWTVEEKNCHAVDGKYFVSANSDKDADNQSFVSVDFEIIIDGSKK